MRKAIFWGTILLLVAMATAACASADYLTIAQLREEAPSHWGQTFETQWRTVRLDAEIRLPNVEAVPLLAVKAGIRNLPLPWIPAAGPAPGLLTACGCASTQGT